jgi:hypothetical protein
MQTTFMQHPLAATLCNSLSLKCPVSRTRRKFLDPASPGAARTGRRYSALARGALGTAGGRGRYPTERPEQPPPVNMAKRRGKMRKMTLVAAALAAGAVGISQFVYQAAAEEMKVTGIVTKADEQSQQITVGDKTFDMSDQAGTAMFPQVGGKVTLSYEERDGKNVVTRIGQAQQ